MGDFPNLDNVDVYRYDNALDYSRFKPTARLKMCNVPWCGDYDNVVKFDDDAARDAWFDALEGETVNLETMFNVKPDGASKVPVPVTSAQGYNYLVVDLPRMTSDARPLSYAAGGRKRRYFYFIQDARQLSPNSTRLILTPDVWTTYINEMRFDYVLLERGHAPVAASSVADYLANPRENSAYLLSDDVNTGGEPYVETARAVKNYSAETQRACIATYADLQGDLGTAAAPKVPAISEPDVSGVLAPRVYSVAVGDIQPFLRALEANAPWMKSTVLGVFFAPSDLLTQSAPFTLWGVPVTVLNAVQKIETFMRPGVADFGYPAQAAGFAKLYTYPYAAIRIGDERGQTSTVRIEDLGANGIRLASAVNLVMPYISIDARLIGIAGATDSLTFQTIEGRTYSYGGAWGEYLKSWNLPVMQISQGAASRAAYTTVYSRAHARLAADNALASSLASNSTAYTNAGNSAKNVTDNNAVNTEANTAVTKNANDWALTGAAASNQKLGSDCDADNETSTAMTGLQNEVVSISTANNNASAIASTAGAVVTGGLTGGPAGAASAAIGGVSDLAVSIPTANAAAAISQTSNSLAAELAKTNALKKTGNAAKFTAETWRIQNNATTVATTLRNEASTKVANNNAGVMRTNAGNAKATGDANANRARATAIDAISAGLNQAGVAAPAQFGASANGQSGATAPRALFAQVVTQRECDIMNAASAFARYGYGLMREFSMERMQVMRHFTYWKCAEVWCSGNGNALESAQGAIKDILIRGVTVWSKPEEIGRVSIYDNL
nr:MAG TPA_asm: Major tail protein [Bacteriophage sp.]